MKRSNRRWYLLTSNIRSGSYARELLRRGSTYVAVLAVPGGESSEAADNSLTFAVLRLRILWRNRLKCGCVSVASPLPVGMMAAFFRNQRRPRGAHSRFASL